MSKRDRGQIIKKGPQKYQLKAYLGRIQGQRKYASKTVHGTRKAAEARLVEWLRSLDTGTFVAPQDSPRMIDALEEWYTDFSRRGVSTIYLRTTRNRLDFDLIPLLGAYRVSQLRPSLVREFVGKVLEEREYAPGTLTHVRSALTRFCKWAQANDLLLRDPMVGVEWPSRGSKGHRGQSLTMEQARAFLSRLGEADHGAYATLFRTLLETGLRPQEACSLQWGDFRTDEDTGVVYLTLQRALVNWQSRSTGHEVKAVGKTGASLGTISVPTGLWKALEGHRRSQASLQPWVFLNQAGELYTQGALQYIWKKYGPVGTRMYDLRHTHATWLIESGVQAAVVQARLRHQRISTTLDTYTHARQALDEQATEAWEAMGDQLEAHG